MNKFLTWIKNGIIATIHDVKKAGALVGFLTLMLLLVTHSDKVFHHTDNTTFGMESLIEAEYTFMLIVLTIAGVIVILIFYGMPIQAIGKTKSLERIGLKNHSGEIPYLVSYSRKGRLQVFEFASCGIPLEDWEKKQEDLEAILNLTIDKMKYTHGTRQIQITAVPAEGDLPEKITWNDWFISPKDFVLVLGEGLTGRTTVNLAVTNSILIGGSTGSGKSVLLRSLLYQAYRKGAEIWLADFKGAVDYTEVWNQMCTIVTDSEELERRLKMLVDLLEDRKVLFKTQQVRNIKEYNEKNPQKRICRIIFACDEVAELLDKTGADKAQKETIARIEGYLSTIARQGRAFGIHLILATQRPDANILSGQIKNNIDGRICGTADNVLSMIILDNTDAADRVPADIQGRFIMRDGTIFQGYWLPDELIQI